jgi:hypothetical protein
MMHGRLPKRLEKNEKQKSEHVWKLERKKMWRERAAWRNERPESKHELDARRKNQSGECECEQ